MENIRERRKPRHWESDSGEKYPRWKSLPGQPEPGATWKDPDTGMVFVWIPSGEFEMGDLFDRGYHDELPTHVVELAGYWIGKYPVTQGEWKKVMGQNPSAFQKGNRYPVENVSWVNVQAFIDRLNHDGHTLFRLPTEAEWEYAARSGGRREEYAGGNHPLKLAWHWENSGKSTHPVGQKKPNGLGLHDMSGNVWEWCQDWYEENFYQHSPLFNPCSKSADGIYRVFRGGGWNNCAPYIRASIRNWYLPDDCYDDLGFRLVRLAGWSGS